MFSSFVKLKDKLPSKAKMVSLFPIEYEITKKLFELRKNSTPDRSRGWEKAYWTKEVKRTLAQIGKDKGYRVLPGEGDNGEWLFDLVWVDEVLIAKRKKILDWRCFRGFKLVCEVEWDSDKEGKHILMDFLKLTVVLADLRVFIYPYRDRKKRPQAADICREVCPLSHGFRYLLVGIPPSPKRQFKVDCWTV